MIILAAMLASGQVLPFLDRRWLDEQARLEAAAYEKRVRPLKLTPPASPANKRKPERYETNGI